MPTAATYTSSGTPLPYGSFHSLSFLRVTSTATSSLHDSDRRKFDKVVDCVAAGIIAASASDLEHRSHLVQSASKARFGDNPNVQVEVVDISDAVQAEYQYELKYRMDMYNDIPVETRSLLPPFDYRLRWHLALKELSERTTLNAIPELPTTDSDEEEIANNAELIRPCLGHEREMLLSSIADEFESFCIASNDDGSYLLGSGSQVSGTESHNDRLIRNEQLLRTFRFNENASDHDEL